MARGCAQRNCMDYTETYAPVMRYNILRYLQTLALEFDLKMNHLDVCTAFLQGNLEDGIPTTDGYLLRLNKPLYGLKQASRMWNIKLSGKLKDLGMRQLKSDQCVYVLNENTETIIVLAVYVDYMNGLWKNEEMKNTLIEQLKDQFKMKDLGPAKSFLGMKIN